MKELLLQAVLDAGTCGITPPALCRWLIALTGGPVEGATGNARKFYHTPCPDVLEIWFQDTLSQQAENVICYSRISFRPASSCFCCYFLHCYGLPDRSGGASS